MSWIPSFYTICTMLYTVSLLFLIVTDCVWRRAFTFTGTYWVLELPQEVVFSSDLVRPAHLHIKASQPFLLRRCLSGAPALCATDRSRRGTSEKCVARVRKRQETPTSTNQVFYPISFSLSLTTHAWFPSRRDCQSRVWVFLSRRCPFTEKSHPANITRCLIKLVISFYSQCTTLTPRRKMRSQY